MRTAVEASTEIGFRQVRDEDSAGLIELIGGCYAEYPGCYLDVEHEESWLLEPSTAYRRWRGVLWVVERDGRVVASGGMRPSGPGMASVHHLYVERGQRRQGLASRLLVRIEAAARERDAHWIQLWSDTRFVEAHRLYRRLGYLRSGGFRELGDRSRSEEYHFVKLLSAASAARGR
jgi:GNAT superfamily N-acetyltransferase